MDKKQIVCPEVAEAGPVESASEFARWRAKDCRNLYIFKIRGPLKYAVDVAVKAEETPRVFLASQKVGEEIIEAWQGCSNRTSNFSIHVFDGSYCYPVEAARKNSVRN